MASRSPRLTPTFMLAVVLLLATAGPSAAQLGSFGDILDGDHDLTTRTLEDGDLPTSWAWLDTDTEDDEDDYDGGQRVYLVQTHSRISENDIRVGSGQVSRQELDDDEDLESLGGSLRSFDENDNGEYDVDDGVYYDVSEDGDTGEISDLDIHLAGSSGSDEDDLDSYSGSFVFFDADGDEAYGEDDDVYLDSDGDDLLTVADVGISGDHEGDMIDDGTDEIVHALESLGEPDRITFHDADADGRLDGDEPVYASSSSSQVENLDVRLANARDGSVGDQVNARDDDHDDPLESLSGELAFFDADGDGSLNTGDILYFDLDGSGSGQASTNDVILTGPEAGTTADAQHGRKGNSLTTYDGEFAAFDADGDEDWSPDDQLYLDTDADGYVNPGDVRLSDDFGRLVRLEDTETTIRLTTTNAPDTFTLLDDDGNNRPSEGDGIYLATQSSRVPSLAIRLAPTPWGDAGSQVRSADDDFGAGSIEIDGDLAFFDGSGDTDFGEDDTLYYDLDDSNADEISVGDLALAGDGDIGIVVTGSHEDIGRNLRSFDGDITIFDADGDGGYTFGDGVLVDSDEDGFATVSDVLLGGPVETQPPPEERETQEDPDPEPEPEPDPEPDEDEDSTDDEARREAREANRSAREAQQAARNATEAAGEARNAAENASEAAQQTSERVDETLERLQRDRQGAPGPSWAALVATLAAVVAARTRRR